MHEQQLDLQFAVDCKQTIDRFDESCEIIPWGPKVNKDVAVYVLGLADWIVGSLNRSFDSTRYFQDSGWEAKRTRVVNLFPRRKLEHPIIHSLSDSATRSNASTIRIRSASL